MPSSRLLTTDDWPEAELRAATLAGDLVEVGACWASIAEPQDAGLRAASFAWSTGDPRVIAAGRTATWIWGARSRPPLPHDACVRAGQRIHRRGGERIREIAITAADLVHPGGVSVTTPVRTALDLLRVHGDEAWSASAESVAGLIAIGAVAPQTLQHRLELLGTVPMVRQAERRLAGLLSPR
ncbi:hypothetical protein ITJ54_02275 [Curtobacterium sp. VKM Ac-2865]|uniref:hypothetical protein n=1 Tax=Curtobacterium sp. VKM Ac-2865 TaxID=2783817 RepID=UPI00188BC5F4|nr:hypothetical protein [Curtobacterium sp. VKM Ac-2865]MBF4581491.1 hypothetical protein [Curtobacterium sp. VKM Ac-2865]